MIETQKAAWEEIYPCGKQGMRILLIAGKTYDCNRNSLADSKICTKG